MDRMTKWMVLAVGLSAVAALCVAETEPVDVDATEIVEQDVEQVPQEPQEEQVAPPQDMESEGAQPAETTGTPEEGDSLDDLLNELGDEHE